MPVFISDVCVCICSIERRKSNKRTTTMTATSIKPKIYVCWFLAWPNNDAIEWKTVRERKAAKWDGIKENSHG